MGMHRRDLLSRAQNECTVGAEKRCAPADGYGLQACFMGKVVCYERIWSIQGKLMLTWAIKVMKLLKLTFLELFRNYFLQSFYKLIYFESFLFLKSVLNNFLDIFLMSKESFGQKKS